MIEEDRDGECPDTEQEPGRGTASGSVDDDAEQQSSSAVGGDDESSSGDGQEVSDSSSSVRGGDDEGSATGSSEEGVESVQLARTGSDAWLLLLVGASSVLAGLVMRSRSTRSAVGA